VEVLYEKGVAIHFGPESCADDREVGREVLTGESASRVLSREIGQRVWGASAVSVCEGPHRAERYREFRPDPTRSETPCAHGSSSHGNREALSLTSGDGPLVRAVNPEGARRR
jgi:hypothetical protein